MKLCLLMEGIVALLCASVASAADEVAVGYWTGAGGNVNWGNAGNWQDGAIPGCLKSSGQDPVGVRGGVAHFGALSGESCKKVVSVGGTPSLASISNIVFDAGAPAYSFQQSEFVKDWTDPYVVLEEYGGIYAAAGNENGATFWSCVQLGNNNNGQPFYIRNDGTGTLAFKELGRVGKKPGASWFSFQLRYQGCGRIFLFGNHIAGRSGWETVMCPQMEASGRLVISNACTTYHSMVINTGLPHQHIELANGARFTFTSANICRVSSDCDLTGGGVLEPLAGQKFEVGGGATWTIDCVVTNRTADSGFTLYRSGSLPCALNLNGDNAFSGPLVADNIIVSIPRFGRAGTAAPLGKAGRYTMTSGGHLRYLGTGEVTDREINVAAAATLEHLGTGTLTFETPFSGTSGITLRTAVGSKIAFAGGQTVPISVADGTSLAFVKPADAEGTVTHEVSSLTFVAGGTIDVADGVTVAFSSLDGTAAKGVDIVTAGTGKAEVSSLAPGLTPAWLTLNGQRAHVLADGTLAPLEAEDVLVDAHGGTIPNAPTEIVAIATAEGPESSALTVAEDATSVMVLRQRQSVEPARLVLGAGQSLAAGMVEVVPGAKPLVVSGPGTITGAFTLRGGDLTRENAETGASVSLCAKDEAELTLGGALDEAAPLDFTETAGALAMMGEGAVKASTFSVKSGTLELGGEGLSLSAPVRVAGAIADNQAAVYQRSGAVSLKSSGDTVFGVHGYGYYELSGGEINFTGSAAFGYRGLSVFALLGGTTRLGATGGRYDFGSTLGLSVVYLKSGTCLQSSAGTDAYLGRLAASATASSVMTVEGPEALFRIKTDNATECRNLILGPGASGVASTSVLNVNDGGKVRCGMLGTAPTRAAGSRVYVNANGGEFISEYLWNTPYFGGSAYFGTVDRVTLFENGLTMNCGTPVKMTVPLSAPTGKVSCRSPGRKRTFPSLGLRSL